MIIWINLILSLILTGLIWTIQLVHYPLFNKVDTDAFTNYIKQHQKLMSFLVIPLMLSELVFAFILMLNAPYGNIGLQIISFALVIIIWASTFFLSVPQHQKLLQGFNQAAYEKLLQSNWIRTIAWTARSLVLLYLI